MMRIDASKGCDVCGKAATSWARDVLRHEDPGAMFVEFSPLGGMKFGCNDHPAQSDEHVTELPFRKSAS